jgi:polyhydroxyalkanoate synthase
VDDATPDEWANSAEKETDSWWSDYVNWLGERSGPEIDAPQTLGSADYQPLAPAPGTYVHQS